MAQLTREQRWAVEAKGGTVLVSAAAGSGKTKVLVERVMSLVTDKAIDDAGAPIVRGNKTCDIDRLLIVTFTRAAAAELRQRLSKELSRLIAAHPADADLRRQKLLLPKAQIGTMDSFCGALVRKNFAAAGVSPDFRIISGAELSVLRSDVLGELLDEKYAEASPGFEKLAAMLSGAKNDNALYSAVELVEHFSEAFPDSAEKLDEIAGMYSVRTRPQNTPWGQIFIGYARDCLDHAARCCASDRSLAAMDEKLWEKLCVDYEAYAESIERARAAAYDNKWNELRTALENIVLPGFRSVAKVKSEYKKQLSASRDVVKDMLAKHLIPCFAISEEDFLDDCIRLYEPISELCNIAKLYRERLDEVMSQRRVMGHSDVAHRALRLLCERDGDGWRRTPLAKELSMGYAQVMIDEFQDTSDVQNLIFCAVSRQESDIITDGSNAFVVGDIKQSIYGFRKAVPALFLDRFGRYFRYSPDDEKYPAKIILDRNFRSRPEVTESVNFFFSHIMRSELGGIEYDNDQRLVSGRSFPPAQGLETEIHYAAKDDEAAYCARLVKRLLDEGLQVTDGDGVHPVRPEDICVMLRAVGNGKGAEYADELRKLSIPVTVSDDMSLFAVPEVSMTLSLLRAIDNPTNSISLLAALRSPIFGCDCDYLSLLADREKDDSIYKKLAAMASLGDEQAERIITRIAALRERSARMPVDRLIVSIYNETGLEAAVQAMPDGDARYSNLIAFAQFARSFESSGSHGLTRFLRMVDRMIECKEGVTAARSAQSGCVTISTIHATKGLEYPVCIIANMDKGFNDEWKKNNMLLHRVLGLGIKLRDEELGAKFPTLQRSAVQLANELDNTAEELRVLYVAMTRAVDKLILLGQADKIENTVQNAMSMIVDGEIAPFAVGCSPSYLKWVTACALLHPDGGELRDEVGMACEYRPAECRLRVVISREKPQENEDEAADDTNETTEDKPIGDIEDVRREIRERLSFEYPYASICSAPSKVTASQVHPDGDLTFAERPSFMTEGGLSATERGTALHRFMQYADFSLAAKSAEKELERLKMAGVLSEREAAAVDISKVEKFFSGRAGAMISEADVVEREWRFTALLSDDMRKYFPECAGDYPVVLEGECDCLLISDGKAQIIDYKTDRAFDGEEGLVERYAPQLELYASAVGQILPVKITGLYIYSFDLSKLIKL